MTEQWTDDWMRDKETGQIIDGPVLNRYEMFMLIRELRVIIDTHTQSIRDWEAVVSLQQARIVELTEALSGLLSYAEVAEDATLVGHEGCHWPVEIAREVIAGRSRRYVQKLNQRKDEDDSRTR